MTTIDIRSRRHREVRNLSPGDFAADRLPDLLSAHGALAARGVSVQGLRPLAITVGNEGFTLRVRGDVLVANPGIDGDAVVADLAQPAFSDLVQDQVSTDWLVMTGQVQTQHGHDRDVAAWGPALRALLDGVAVYEPEMVALRDRDGGDLNLHRSFEIDDPPEEVGYFLSQAGFLHLRGVFTEAEMADVSAELDDAMADATRDDGQSWWARTGEDWYPARILGFNGKSPTLRHLLRDERFQAIRRFTDDEFIQSDIDRTDMAEGLYKKIGVEEGISDVPWHKDCSPGGHSYGCAGLTVGISVTGADRYSGELGVVAGSHRANVSGIGITGALDLPRIALPTSTGDCTVHTSCTLHMSRPPESKERRVCYTGFQLAPMADDQLPTVTNEEARQARAALDDLGASLDRPPVHDGFRLDT
jgi:hypothetical protein